MIVVAEPNATQLDIPNSVTLDRTSSVTDQYIPLAYGDFEWEVLERSRFDLFDQHGLRFPEWHASGAAILIKAGAGRTIHRVRTGELDIYIKHFRANKWGSRVHQLFRRDRAKKEFEIARMLRERNVPTILPIAFGERRKAGMVTDSYLISESIVDGVTLFDLIERFIAPGRVKLTPALRFQFADALGCLAARIHNAGVEHRDLHERNIIVRPLATGGFEFFMLDLHELKMRPGREWKWAERDLSRMGRYFTLRTSAADRRRFFEAYARERRLGEASISSQAHSLERAVVESRADFWRRRDVRGPSKYNRIYDYRSVGARAFAVPELPEPFVRELMAKPDMFFSDSVAKWWKQGRSTRVADVNLPQIRHGEPLVYKQHFFKGWHESLATIFRPNQAERAWNNGAALVLRELPTPRPLVLIHRTIFGLPISSYLLTERINGVGLREYVEAKLASTTDKRLKRNIVLGVLTATARLIRTMHDRRVTHRDLKASNILASETSDPTAPELWLIDLDGVSTWRNIPDKHRWQNLARINVSFLRCPWISNKDRMRFLRLYLGRSFNDRKLRRALWHNVAKATDAKLSKNHRRGRSVL